MKRSHHFQNLSYSPQTGKRPWHRKPQQPGHFHPPQKTTTKPQPSQLAPLLRTSQAFEQLPKWIWSEIFAIFYNVSTKRFQIHFSTSNQLPLHEHIKKQTSATGEALRVYYAIRGANHKPIGSPSLLVDRLGTLPQELMTTSHEIWHRPGLQTPVEVKIIKGISIGSAIGLGQNIGQAADSALASYAERNRIFTTGKANATVAEQIRMSHLNGQMTKERPVTLVPLV